VFLWRISNHTALEGTGGLLASGRWHSKGRPIIYCAPDPSTALLEVLVHTGEIDLTDAPLLSSFYGSSPSL
jgi:RES domain-containing protein